MIRFDRKQIHRGVSAALLALIYGLFLTFTRLTAAGEGHILSARCQFIAIALCFLLACLPGRTGADKKDLLLLRLGLFCTVLADGCMVLAGRDYIGLLAFCVVQMLSIARFGRVKLAWCLFWLYGGCLLLWLFIPLPAETRMVFFACFYAVCLLSGVFSAFAGLAKGYANRFACAGMVLFLLCDVCVCLYNLPVYVSASPVLLRVSDAVFFWIWVFYLNAQVLLAKSGRVRAAFVI